MPADPSTRGPVGPLARILAASLGSGARSSVPEVPESGEEADRSPAARLFETTQRLLLRALSSGRLGAVECAAALLDQVEGLDRESVWSVLELRALAEIARGEEGRAAAHFRRLAIRGTSAPARAAGLRGLGEIALRRGRIAEAVRVLRRAIEAEGPEPRSRVLLAVAFGLLPDDDRGADEWEDLERGIQSREVLVEQCRRIVAGHQAFVRRCERSEPFRRRVEGAAPSVFRGSRLAERSLASGESAVRFARAAADLARLARAARSARRWMGLALPRIARAAGYPRVSLRRGSGSEETILCEWGDGAGPARAPRVREVIPLPGAEAIALVLESSHAWSLGGDAARFVGRAAGLLAERMRRTEEGAGEAIDWREIGVRLGARSVGLFGASEEGERPALLARGGAEEVPVPDADDPRLVSALAGASSLERKAVVLPVAWEGRVLGALALRSRRGDLGAREVRRAEAFAALQGVRRARARFEAYALARWRVRLRIPTLDAPAPPHMRDLVRAARADVSILLHGESGTGKESLARFAHCESGRRGRAFVVFDAASVPEGLAEAELFGVADGAFTGARPRAGLLESAHGGTLLLDGVDGLAPSAQARLLRALEARAVRRLGGESHRPADVRIVATMRGDPGAEVRASRLRADLFHRIGAVVLRVPPLRERRLEIPVLARVLLERQAGPAASRAIALEPDAIALLWRQSWPGNVRELENFLCKAMALRPEGALDAGALRAASARFGSTVAEALPTRGARAREELVQALLTARSERRARIGRAAALLGWHPDTVSRAIRRDSLASS